jgi:hypothetical protein
MLMQAKNKALDTIHQGLAGAEALHRDRPLAFDYGNLSRIPRFDGSHPAVMADFMAGFDWADQLRYQGPPPNNRHLFKHERWKYRAISWLENHLLGGRELGGFHNYELLKGR